MSSSEVPTHFTDDIKEKIKSILQTYPKVSPSMLQITLGSSLPSGIWKPMLEELITDGTVKREVLSTIDAVSGRAQTKTILSLSHPS